ncbi:MAG TPA: GAP family protein [Solirubrobacterales bacterium]|nr:GAP family protein [Solirubrobacterales bacterium]
MGQAIGQVLAFGVGVSLSPIPIVGVVVMLTTPRARRNGPAFVLGWIVGMTIAGTLALLLAGGIGLGASGSGSDRGAAIKLALGVLLLAIAVKQWRRRPHGGEEATMPRWLQSVDHFDAARAAGLGVVLSALNPKNLLLVLGAAAAISGTEAASGDQAVALAIFILIGTIGPAIPVAIFFTMGERSKHQLEELRAWMAHSSAAIMAVICLLIAAKLIGDGISGLSA